jgi:hypothetical protein
MSYPGRPDSIQKRFYMDAGRDLHPSPIDSWSDVHRGMKVSEIKTAEAALLDQVRYLDEIKEAAVILDPRALEILDTFCAETRIHLNALSNVLNDVVDSLAFAKLYRADFVTDAEESVVVTARGVEKMQEWLNLIERA